MLHNWSLCQSLPWNMFVWTRCWGNLFYHDGVWWVVWWPVSSCQWPWAIFYEVFIHWELGSSPHPSLIHCRAWSLNSAAPFPVNYGLCPDLWRHQQMWWHSAVGHLSWTSLAKTLIIILSWLSIAEVHGKTQLNFHWNSNHCVWKH